jgi:hypothetical protein
LPPSESNVSSNRNILHPKRERKRAPRCAYPLHQARKKIQKDTIPCRDPAVSSTSTTRKEDPKRSKNTSRERGPKIHEKDEKKRSRKTPSHVETPLCQTPPPHAKRIQKDPKAPAEPVMQIASSMRKKKSKKSSSMRHKDPKNTNRTSQ